MLDGNREIGRIEQGTIRFTGFASPNSAAVAAQAAIRALARRRARSIPADGPDELVLASHGNGQYLVGRSSLLARLVPPEATGAAGWGFDVALRFDEQAPVFAMSRARTMWQAVRNAGLAGSSSPGRSDIGADTLAVGGAW